MLLPDLLRALAHTRPCLQYGQWQAQGVELLAAAQGVRTSLASLGVSSGERVAFILPNHPALPVVWLAILSLRGVAVPLHPGLTPVELETLIRAARPKVLVGLAPFMRSARDVCVRLGVEAPRLLRLACEGLDESLHRIQREHHARLLELERVFEPGGEDEGVHPLFVFQSERVFPSDRVSPSEGVELLETLPVQVDTPAVLLFTSGTTGAPKGAVLSHGNLGSNGTAIARDWFGGLAWEREAVGPKVLAVLPLCHNFGLNVTLDATWLAGGVSVLLPRFSAVEVARAIGQAEVSVLPLVPTMTQALLPRLEVEPRLAQSLRLLVSGGAALPGVLRERVKGLWPWLELRDTYGLTETSLLATTGPGRAQPGSVGRAIEHTELRIVSEQGALGEVGEVGEVQMRGPGRMLGYWPLSDQTRLSAEDWWSTGDLGKLEPDGCLVLVDRKKDLISHGGQKVYPLEVEDVLYRHPAVREALVFGVPDVRMGEKVVAAISLREGWSGEAEVKASVLAYCRSQLAGYKVPMEVRILEELPRGSTGKLLRRALRSGS